MLLLSIFLTFDGCNHDIYNYDAVSDVVESGVQWRSNFQIGSTVLKNCYKPILMAYNVIYA